MRRIAKICRRWVLCFLAFLTVFSSETFLLPAFADTNNISMYDDGFTWKNTLSFVNPVNGTTQTFNAGENLTRLWFKSEGIPGYCIEPGAPISKGSTFGSGDTNYWKKVGIAKRWMIAWALLYGYPNNTAFTGDAYIGYPITQIIIWEYILGYRDLDTSVCHNRSLINNLSVPGSYRSTYMSYYNDLDQMLVKNNVFPSFMSYFPSNAPTYTLKYNAAAGDYEITLTDSNSVVSLPDMNLSASGIYFNKLNNKTLKISTREIISKSSPVSIKSTKNIPVVSRSEGVVVWSSSNKQELVTGSKRPDPVPGYMKLQTESIGSVKIVKTSEDGVVANRTFQISGNGVNKTVTTGAGGTITIPNLVAGTYTVQETNVPAQYNKPAAKSVTVVPGKTVSISFSNTLKKGYVELRKTDTETGGKLANAVFGIYNNSNVRVGGLKTNSAGYAKSGLLKYGSYYIKEETAPTGYVLDKSKTSFKITANGQTVSLGRTDMSQKGTITIKKTDGETKKPLAGAVFNIVAAANIKTADGTVRAKAGSIVNTITTGKDGTAKSKTLYLGKYTVKEKKAPAGYVLDTQPHSVTLSYGGQNATLVGVQLPLGNIAQKAGIKIEKTDQETGKPLAGAVFDILAAENIKTADGTVRAKVGTLVDTITTGADGTATSKLLYLGKYTAKEKTAPPGYVLDTGQHDVTLAYAGQEQDVYTQTLSLDDLAQKASIRIEKIDQETGKPLTDATFEIYAAEDVVTADGTVRAAAGTLVDTVTTGKDGTAESKLLYLGKYTAKEKTAPPGYVLDTGQHDVTLVYAGQEQDVYTQTLSLDDLAQKASIMITKTDRETEKPLGNATFEIYAAEDVVTADGTVRAATGTLVDTVTTGKGGTAESKLLYLGKYTVKEKTAPPGYVLDTGQHDVSLDYTGQEQKVYTKNLDVDDLAQKAKIKITKRDDETGALLPNAVYEIYTAEDITTADGTIRAPNGTLVDTVTTGRDGTAESKLLYLGKYTVREITAPQGYVLDTKIYDVSLRYKGQNVDVYTEPLGVEDRMVRGRLEIHKVSSFNGASLSNAMYGIYDTSNGNLMSMVWTGPNGVVAVDGLLYGDYYIKELEPAPRYHINKTMYRFLITEDGATVRLSVQDDPVIGFVAYSYTPPTKTTESMLSYGIPLDLNKSLNPKTGEFPGAIPIAIFLIVLSGGIFIYLKRR